MGLSNVVPPEKIVEILNNMMAQSDALGGDCRDCRVNSLRRFTEDEAAQLGRNWNVERVNGACQGECMAVLEEIARSVGREYEAEWA